jgi:hypothetical protein
MTTARLTTLATLVLLLVTCGAVPASFAAKVYHADRYDITITVEPGGSLRVTERIQFVFGPDSFETVYRGLPTGRTDGVHVLSASMDGQSFVPGKGPGHYEVRRRDNGMREVIWHFAPLRASTHVFEVSYRAGGVVRLESKADLLEWNALPTKHEYAIGCASIDMLFPPGAGLVDSPVTEPASALQLRGRVAHFERCGLRRDDRWLLRATFTPRSVVLAQPAWQRRATRVARGLPLFLGLAAMILLAGVGGFVVFSLRQRSPIHDDFATGRDPRAHALASPDDLPSALGAALTQRGTATWATGLATMFGLAARGVLRIEETPGGVLRKRDFVVTAPGPTKSLRPFERAFCELLFTSGGEPRRSVRFSEFGRIFGSLRRWKTFAKTVTAELRHLGLIDEERERTKSRGTVVALCFIGMAFVSFFATIPFVDEWGGPPLMIGAAFMVVGIAGLILSQSISSFTDDAQRRAGAWHAYGRALKELSHNANGPAATARSFEQALPAAVAFGAAIPWAKALRKRGITAAPAWLSAIGQEDVSTNHMDAMIGMLTACTATGHYVDQHSGAMAGGVGAGAAGGGTSGAH